MNKFLKTVNDSFIDEIEEVSDRLMAMSYLFLYLKKEGFSKKDLDNDFINALISKINNLEDEDKRKRLDIYIYKYALYYMDIVVGDPLPVKKAEIVVEYNKPEDINEEEEEIVMEKVWDEEFCKLLRISVEDEKRRN